MEKQALPENTFDSDEIVQYVSIPEDVVGMDAFDSAEQEILDVLNRRAASGESLDDVMDFLYETSKGVWPCDRIGLAFVDDDGMRVTSRWVRAEYSPVVMKIGFTEDLSGSTLKPLIEGKVLRVITDMEEYGRRNPDSRSTKILLAEGVMSSMTCPLVVDGRCVGLLFRSSRKKDVYGPREVWMHLAISERLAQAVDKAWKIRRLEQVNSAYMEMLGFVAHELKSPVASMVMDATTLIEGYLGELDEQQKKSLNKMVDKGEYLLGLVREYMDLARLEGGELSLNTQPGVDMTALVRESADILEARFAERNMTFETAFPEDAADSTLECDPVLMKIVTVNLIGNGVKYGIEGGTVKVTIEPGDGLIKVFVCNEGPGFSEKDRLNLFKKFSRLKNPELMKRKGTGVGLYTVWRVVNLHGGRVDARSEQGSWAEFSFEVPVEHSAD